MIRLRPSKDRRHLEKDGHEMWMSFDSTSPRGFRALDSLTERAFAPGSAAVFYPDQDLVLLTYVRQGTVTQEDPSGGTAILQGGACRRSFARSGTRHPSVNRSSGDAARAFQWGFRADRRDIRLGADQRLFPRAERKGLLRLLASPEGTEGSLRLLQDVRVYSSLLDPGHHLIHELVPGRGAWLQLVDGRVQLPDDVLCTGDGASFVGEAAVSLTALEPSEILIFDLA